MNHNIIIYKEESNINYKDFAIYRNSHNIQIIGNGKYIYRTENIIRAIEKKSKIIIRGLYNTTTGIKKEATDYEGIYQITECKEQRSKYGIIESKITLRNIFTNEIKTCDVRFRKVVARISVGNCPQYTYVLCNIFPVMQQITNFNEKKYSVDYCDNKLIFYDDETLKNREIDISCFDENIKKRIEETEEEIVITIQTYYTNDNGLMETKVLEVITDIKL